MNSSRHIQNIALIGFMGTGKSSVGRMLADQLGFGFLDTDEQIEKLAGKSISQIFAQEGEPVFRNYERQIVTDLGSQTKLIISTGGGLGANAENLAALKNYALTVCLWASAETIWERVRTQRHRPILETADPLGKIRELLAAREPFYKQADVLVNTERRSTREVTQQVLHQFSIARLEAR